MPSNLSLRVPVRSPMIVPDDSSLEDTDELLNRLNAIVEHRRAQERLQHHHHHRNHRKNT